jgi:hypothetical protein
VKVTFQIPDALYRELKIETAREGLTMREVTISLFEQWLRQKNSPQRSRRQSIGSTFRPRSLILFRKTSPITGSLP